MLFCKTSSLCKNRFLLGALVCLSACQTAPQERNLSSLTKLPERFSQTEAQKRLSEIHSFEWWKGFQRKDLDLLMQAALDGNLGLQEAWTRLKKAQITAAQAGVQQFPSLNASLDYKRLNLGNNSASNQYSAGFSAAYEIDLWGKIRAGRKAAEFSALASAEDTEATALVLTSQIANKWVDLISTSLQLKLLEEQMKANKTSLELIELRFDNSRSTALDVFQQRKTVAQTKSQLPSTESNLERLKYEMALLLGKPAHSEFQVQYESLPDLPVLPELGLTTDVLKNRPDIKTQLARLQSADWTLSNTEVKRLPSLSLSLNTTSAVSNFSDLFEEWTTNLLAGLTQSLLDGGQRALAVEKQKADVEEKLIALKSAYLEAYNEVETALLKERKLRESHAALEEEFEMTRLTYEEAQNRYANGLTEYLTVITNLTRLQALERQLVSSQGNLLKAHISLHVALGGHLLSAHNKTVTDNSLSKQSPLLHTLAD